MVFNGKQDEAAGVLAQQWLVRFFPSQRRRYGVCGVINSVGGLVQFGEADKGYGLLVAVFVEGGTRASEVELL